MQQAASLIYFSLDLYYASLVIEQLQMMSPSLLHSLFYYKKETFP